MTERPRFEEKVYQAGVARVERARENQRRALAARENFANREKYRQQLTELYKARSLLAGIDEQLAAAARELVDLARDRLALAADIVTEQQAAEQMAQALGETVPTWEPTGTDDLLELVRRVFDDPTGRKE